MVNVFFLASSSSSLLLSLPVLPLILVLLSPMNYNIAKYVEISGDSLSFYAHDFLITGLNRSSHTLPVHAMSLKSGLIVIVYCSIVYRLKMKSYTPISRRELLNICWHLKKPFCRPTKRQKILKSCRSWWSFTWWLRSNSISYLNSVETILPQNTAEVGVGGNKTYLCR